jgi:hypothetical protein
MIAGGCAGGSAVSGGCGGTVWAEAGREPKQPANKMTTVIRMTWVIMTGVIKTDRAAKLMERPLNPLIMQNVYLFLFART